VWLEPRLADLSAKDRQLVPEHEDLQLLRPLASAEKHDKLEQAAEDDVDDRHKQRRPPTDGIADASGASATRSGNRDRVYAPHALAERAVTTLQALAVPAGKGRNDSANLRREP
jgi:hypothetical protein